VTVAAKDVHAPQDDGALGLDDATPSYDVVLVAMAAPAWPPMGSATALFCDRLGAAFLGRLHEAIRDEHCGELGVAQSVVVAVVDWVYGQLYKHALIVSLARSPQTLYPYDLSFSPLLLFSPLHSFSPLYFSPPSPLHSSPLHSHSSPSPLLS